MRRVNGKWRSAPEPTVVTRLPRFNQHKLVALDVLKLRICETRNIELIPIFQQAFDKIRVALVVACSSTAESLCLSHIKGALRVIGVPKDIQALRAWSRGVVRFVPFPFGRER